jgi:hypothetical protein
MATQVYIAIAIVGLLLIAATLYLTARSGKRPTLTPLTGIALALIVASSLFEENRLIAYGLIGAAVILAVVDALRRRRSS